MGFNRRQFVKLSSILSLAYSTGIGKAQASFNQVSQLQGRGMPSKPVVISTWDFGLKANEEAWKVLSRSGSSLDAVESGVKVIEADPSNQSVGIGGSPDRDGRVTLDASIMTGKGSAGSVASIENILHPVSVARLVMEKTPHVLLVGDGALQFALEQGFSKTDLLTEESKQAWLEWKRENHYSPVINIENHDTVGILALDITGKMAGACSTSGLAYKIHGRVGDSPIIGAGLFVDDEAGAAVATGLGEYVLKTLGSFLTVEIMRRGGSPSEACFEAIHRIVKKYPEYKDFQVAIIAMDPSGNTGSYAIHKGFNYALRDDEQNKLFESEYYEK